MHRKRLLCAVVGVGALAAAGCTFIAPASISSTGTSGNGPSGAGSRNISVSGDGRYVAYVSSATNLVSSDTNGADDIFVHDYQSGTTTRVSVATGGAQANGPSAHPSITTGGKIVVFSSTATNLVAGDTNGVSDIFIRDLDAGTTTRITNTGTQLNGASTEPVITGDGSYIAFTTAARLDSSDTNGVTDVVRYYVPGDYLEYISKVTGGAIGNGASSQPAIFDYNFDSDVSFTSTATNLDSHDTNSTPDVFYGSSGGVRASVSGGTGGTDSSMTEPHPSQLPFTLEVAYRTPAGRIARAVNVGGGSIYTSTIIDPGANGPDAAPSISSDGNVVAFESLASNLVDDDTNGVSDVFVYHALSGTTNRASSTIFLLPGNGASTGAATSGDGRYVAFGSDATNLETNPDTNGVRDVFLAYSSLPYVSSVSPSYIERGGSLGYTLTGAAFESGATIKISGTGVAASAATFVSDTKLTVTLTAASDAATGPRDLFILNPGGGPGAYASAAGRCIACVTVVDPMSVTSMTPPAISHFSQPVLVTITGTGFIATPSVMVSGSSVSATGISYVDATHIHAMISALGAAPGPRNVIVFNPNGDSATCSSCLTIT